MAEASSPIQEEPVLPAAEAPEEKPAKVPTGRKVAWGVASISDQLIGNGISTLAMPIYNLGLKVDPRLLGWALALPRIFDAIIDPAIGNLSDNTRSRWGRRRPYVFVGAILMAIFFTFMWMPPKSLMGKEVALNLPSFLGGTTHIPQLGIFFLITSMFCFFGYAIFAIPRGAMGIEMSTDYHERTRIFALNTFFAYAASFLMPWLYNFCFQAGHFFGGSTIQNPEILGVRYVGAGVGIIMLLCGIAPALFIKDKGEGIQSQPKTSLIKGFAMTFTSYPFWLMFFIIFIILLACALVTPMAMYIGIDYVFGGNREASSYLGGIGGIVNGIVGITMPPVVVWIDRRLGKKMTMVIGQIIAILSFISSWWLYTPHNVWLGMIVGATSTIGFSCVWVLSGSVMADICDTDELKYGLRREGMFGAIYQFLIKASSSSVVIVAGYALVWAGYEAKATVQSMETLTNMRLLFILITVSGLTVSIILTLLFPITEKSAREVRAILDARRREKALEEARGEA